MIETVVHVAKVGGALFALMLVISTVGAWLLDLSERRSWDELERSDRPIEPMDWRFK